MVTLVNISCKEFDFIGHLNKLYFEFTQIATQLSYRQLADYDEQIQGVP